MVILFIFKKIDWWWLWRMWHRKDERGLERKTWLGPFSRYECIFWNSSLIYNDISNDLRTWCYQRMNESHSVLSDSLWHHRMDSSRPGFSVHGFLQARILECVAVSFSRGSSKARDQTQVSHIAGRFFTIWAIREALMLPGEQLFMVFGDSLLRSMNWVYVEQHG